MTTEKRGFSTVLRPRDDRGGAHDMITGIVQKVLAEREISVMAQLNWFIRRGILELHQGELMFTKEPHTDEITISQVVELKLKNQEYIEELERQNKKLGQKLEQIQRALEVFLKDRVIEDGSDRD